LGKVEQPVAAPAAAGREIDERYAALLTLMGDGAGAPVDLVLKSLIDVQQHIAKQAAAPIGTTIPTPPGGDPAAILQTAAAKQPEPLSRWLAEIASSATSLRTGNLKTQVAAVFNGSGGLASACPAAVNLHYPFARGSANDVSLAEFSRVFGPGGLLDGFVNTLLRPFIDMSGSVWRPQAVEGVQAPVAAADLAQFQRGAAIRDMFFAGGSAVATIRLDITPVSVDATTKQVTLELGCTTVTASHETPHSTQVTWPGSAQKPAARLVFDPAPSGSPGVLQDTGPWAMFRLFSRAKAQPGSKKDRVTFTFRLGDREAAFEVRVNSGANPLTSGLLQEFRCPAVSGM
jgi:type VI secretion system protein ImpL